tara:strand:- start:1413 stop:1574 length:162 start_codon:yes stop_codon:yes gene_type:complete
MNRDQRQVFFKEVRKAIKNGAPKPTLAMMLELMPDDSKKGKAFRKTLAEMLGH